MKKHKKTVSKEPKKRHSTYWHVFWRVNGHECSLSCGKWTAAEQAVGVIGGKADLLVVARCSLNL